MELDLARALIAATDEASLDRLLRARHPGMFWVDWREGCDDIVSLAAEAMQRDDLAPAWRDEQLHIAFADRSIRVPLDGRHGDQDITLLAINRILAPQYEIRFVQASEGGDTTAFLVLTSGALGQLEAEFGGAVAQALRPLRADSPLFAAPEQTREEVLAQMAAANPGFMTGLRFARAAYRILGAHDAAEARARVGDDAALRPAIRPLCGDLVVGYFHDRRDGAETITEGELVRYATTVDQLDAAAQRYSNEAWSKFTLQQTYGFTRILGADRLSAASLALCRPFWTDVRRRFGEVLVVFAQPDCVAFAPATAVDAIGFLVEALDGLAAQASATLSTQLYRFDDAGWQAHPIDARQRTFRHSDLWTRAERGDVAAQFEVAERYRFLGLYAEAVAHYRRTADQVARAPVPSEDMFKNGSAAICNLADKYEHGLGVTQDLRKAAELYLRAAKMNNHVAQFDLGALYRDGRGVPRDPELARIWFERSAAQGFDLARKALRELDGPGSAPSH